MSLIEDVSLFVLLVLTVIFVGTLKYNKDWWNSVTSEVDELFDRLRDIDPRFPTAVVVAVLVLLLVNQDGMWSSLLFIVLLSIVTVRVLSHVLLDLPVISDLVGDRWQTALRSRWVLPANVHDTNALSLVNRLLGMVPLPRRSILVMGASGSGKTEAAKHILYQTDFGEAPIVVFDRKDDYQQMFEEQGIDYKCIRMDESDVIWNCFEEFENERDIDEFARSLYPEGSDFFDKAAPMVFAAVIKSLVRQNDGFEGLTNDSLVNYFNRSSIEQIYEDISEYEDLTGAASAIDAEMASKQAQGVYANLQQTINRVFVGDFEEAPNEDHDSFSMREYMDDPDGALVLDYPNRNGETTKPIFRFLIDQAASFAMDQDGTSYFILDEFAQIPHLRRIETLLNVGRGEGVHVLSTLQSVAQINDNYGEDQAESMLAGFSTQILLRANDESTVDHVQGASGTEWHEDGGDGVFSGMINLFAMPGGGQFQKTINEADRDPKRTEQHYFAAGEIRRWDPGEGVIVRNDGWIKAYLPLLEDTKDRYDQAMNPDPSPWEQQETETQRKTNESVAD